jgi:cytoskeletal protein RodZ
VSIGEDLAGARRHAGLSVTQVSQRTCIRETLIRGIERDDYGACGGDFYARGHIRSIARAVGTDPGPLIQDYDATRRPPRPSTTASLFGPVMPVEPRQRHRAWWVVAAALVAALLAAGVYYLTAGRHQAPGVPHAVAVQKKQPAPRPRTAPGTSPAAPVTSAAAQPYAHVVVIRLKAVEDCWVDFTTPHGGYLFQAYVFGGTTKRWTFRHPVDMSLGNPGGISLMVDGKHPLPAGTDMPVTLHLGLNAEISG